MKLHHATRRYTNTKGLRQLKAGRTSDQVKRIAKKLGIKYAP